MPVIICHFSVTFVTFCLYFQDSSLLASFVEIWFMRGPMTLRCDRCFAACTGAEEHLKLHLPVQPSSPELSHPPGLFKVAILSNMHRF